MFDVEGVPPGNCQLQLVGKYEDISVKLTTRSAWIVVESLVKSGDGGKLKNSPSPRFN